MENNNNNNTWNYMLISAHKQNTTGYMIKTHAHFGAKLNVINKINRPNVKLSISVAQWINSKVISNLIELYDC